MRGVVGFVHHVKALFDWSYRPSPGEKSIDQDVFSGDGKSKTPSCFRMTGFPFQIECRELS